MTTVDRLRFRTILTSSGVTIGVLAAALLLALASDGSAQSCTGYAVTGSTPPAIANWTDTSGLWTPSGSYPGENSSCDTATDTNASPTTIYVNTAIPNSIGDLLLSCNGCVVDIQAGGSLTLGAGSAATIGNGSTLKVSGGTFTMAPGSNVYFQSGSNFEFSAGTIDIQSGAVMNFQTGSNGVTTGGVMGGSGTLLISGGTLTIGSVVSPAIFAFTAGVLDGPGFLSIGQAFYWDGGTIKGSGGTELAGGGEGVFSGVSGPMLLDGRTFNNYGLITYPATTNMLHLTNNAAFNTYGTFQFQDDGDIIADGPSSVGIFPNGFLEKHAGSGVSVIQPATTNNATVWVTSGTLEFAGSGTHSGSFIADNDSFNPIGTIAFSAANSAINGAVYGSGDVSFPSGTAEYDGFFFAVGHTWITGGTLTLDSSASTTDFTFNSGALELIADFDMSGTGTWSGGTMRYDDGTFYVDPGATLTIDSANDVTKLETAVIDNEGTINYTATGSLFVHGQKAVRALSASAGYLELQDSATIFNDGLFDMQTDAPIVSSTGFIGDSVKGGKSRRHAVAAAALRPIVTARGRTITHRARTMGKHAFTCGCPNDIENFSTLQKSAGTGATDFGPSFGNSGNMKALSGTINFQSDYFQDDGATTLGPGNIQVAFPMDVEGGIVDGSGTITGDVDNYGEVKPGTPTAIGTIKIAGNFEMGVSPGSGAVTIKIAGPAAGQFDQLDITGTAALDATFNGSFINGYVPATGTTTWPVITYASETGTFATVNPPAYSGGTVTHAYNSTSFDLTAVTPATADLKLLMNGPATVNAGAPLSYTIDVSSLGPDATSGVITVTDTLPAGFGAPVNGSGTGWTCGAPSGGTITCTNPGPLTSGNALPTLTISMTAPIASGNVTNSATVSNSFADPVPSNNTASVTTNVGPQANLAITKTAQGPGTVNPGQNIVYSIVVQNNGPSAATSPLVTDNTPAGLVFVSASGGGCTSFPCTLPTLSAGQSVTITATYNVPSNYSGGAITNTASVSSAVNDPNISDNQSSTTTSVGTVADVAITKTGPSTINLGQNITYTIMVSNSGPAGATGVTVNDPTPTGLTPISVSGGGCTTFPCTIGALAVGPQVTITATYNVPSNYSQPDITNTAFVTSGNDPNSSNSYAVVTTTVAANADLGVTKSGPPSAVVGTTVSYTITVTNSGALAAANTFVADPTPAGLTPAGVSGGGCSSFPCALGTVNPGQSIVITATYNVPLNYAGTSVSNTASVSTSSPESNTSNNSATAVTPISSAGVADLSVTTSGPPTAQANGFVDFTIVVFNNGPSTATNVVISNPTPGGLQFLSANGACSTPFPCIVSSLGTGKLASVTGHYRVVAPSGSVTDTGSASSSETDPVAANNSSSASVTITPANTCPQAPIQTTPAAGATVTSPVTFSWSAVPNATGYVLSIITGGSTQTLPATTATSLTQMLVNGAYSWTVQALGNSGCPNAATLPSSFIVCNNPGAPIASVVGMTTTGQTYTVEWTPIDGATSYELQESADLAFPVSTIVSGTSQSFTKNVQSPITYFYRVRAFGGCFQNPGPFSIVAPIVIVPLPPLGTININVPVPSGSKQPVTFPLHVDGIPNLTTSFFATVDKPWLAVTPASGIMPPEGINFTISADPSTLQDGTWTGTVIIVYGANGVSGKTALDVAPKTSIPVSISLTTPVTPSTLTGPSATAVIIPSVGHLAGLGSQWQSDIRIANITALSKKVQLTFSAGSATSQAVKQTTISIDPGATTALDDIVRNWFGTGAMGDSSNGVLTVQPLDLAGKPDLSVVKSTVASSRTFNTSAAGTLGQFIPAVPLSNFISKAPGSASILTLQQIAQSDTFHTNLGLVEATGKAASVLVSVFNGGGSKVLDIPINLAAGEQRQLNSFLADKGVTLTNGHIEVSATGGDGKVTAYASVVDSRTSDPLLVSGVPIGGPGAARFVIPGVGGLVSGASWRSDVRIFNSSNSPQTATMTLYPTGNPAASVSRDTTIQPGEVKALDDIVHSTFNLTNAGGALHVTTAVATPLVVTARTFNDTPAGTLGQFLQAVTPADSVGAGERSLQLLQMEDSPRYRTNLGLAETTGKQATAEVTVILPDSKVAPKVSIPLAAFEYRQFSIISSLGLGNTYNARISVRVIDGQGKITAYGSVIDQKTQDPTFVPGQ